VSLPAVCWEGNPLLSHRPLAINKAIRPDLSFREDVTKLQKGDFFASKLIVFSVTFGRKTKKSQPPTEAARLFLSRSLLRTSREVEESLFDLSRKPLKTQNNLLLDYFSVIIFAR
jgi:hypothetical protein